MLVGIVGFANSGKGTIGTVFNEQYDFNIDSYAALLKDVTATLFGWDRVLLEGDTDESRHWREQADRFWSDELGIKNFTPRMALQLLGTDAIRNIFHKDFWIISLKRRWMNTDKSNTVITDCRFSNEIDIIRSLGGVIIHVQRGPNPGWYNDILFVNRGYADDKDIERINLLRSVDDIPHESETEWIGSPVDYKIHNDDTLDELINKIKKVAEKIIVLPVTNVA